jgi:hypothetical protein
MVSKGGPLDLEKNQTGDPYSRLFPKRNVLLWDRNRSLWKRKAFALLIIGRKYAFALVYGLKRLL